MSQAPEEPASDSDGFSHGEEKPTTCIRTGVGMEDGEDQRLFSARFQLPGTMS
jgi:hypothetical protein